MLQIFVDMELHCYDIPTAGNIGLNNEEDAIFSNSKRRLSKVSMSDPTMELNGISVKYVTLRNKSPIK